MTYMRPVAAGLLAVAILCAGMIPALADRPKIVNARILLLHENSYEVQVTVGHEDSSWDHYVDRWEVIDPGGKILGTRVFVAPAYRRAAFSARAAAGHDSRRCKRRDYPGARQETRLLSRKTYGVAGN